MPTFSRKYYLLSFITSYLLQKLRKYHLTEEQMLVFSQDLIGEQIFAKGVFEREEIDSVLNSLNFDVSNDTCLDIGANIGNHSIQFSKRFKKVYSYEPNPVVFQVLKINTENIGNITTYNYGLSDANTRSYFEFDKSNTGGGHVVEDETNSMIELRKFDDEFNESFSFVKIDVEGHELNVLKGMEKEIQKNKPIICFELRDYKEASSPKVVDYLKSLGYSKFYIPAERNFLKKYFPSKFKALCYLTFGLFFANRKYDFKLEEIRTFSNFSYPMVVGEHKSSNYQIK